MKKILTLLLGVITGVGLGSVQAQIFYDTNDTAPGYGAYNGSALTGNNWTATDGGLSATSNYAGAGGTANSTVVFTVGEGSFSANSQFITGNLAVGGLTWRSDAANPATTNRNNVGLNGDLTFASGTVVEVQDVYNTNDIDLTFSGALNGDFEKTGAGGLQLRPGVTLTGTATVSAGQLWLHQNVNFGVDSRFHVTTGEIRLGWPGGPNAVSTVTIGGLSGGGLFDGGSGNATATSVIEIANGHGLDFSGTINGGGSNFVSVVKSGGGTQIFSGNNTYDGTTTITGGTLLVNGTHTNGNAGNNPDPVSGAAYQVTGGILGGTGTITTAGGVLDGVRVAGTGQLAPGTDGTIGTLTFDLGSGGMNLSDIGAGALLFDLGATADQVAITGGLTLNNLGFSNFTFNELPGLGATTFTLFSSSSLTGGLDATDLSGVIGTDWIGTLGISGNNVLLTVAVIPEPGTAGLLLAGVGVLVCLRRQRSRQVG